MQGLLGFQQLALALLLDQRALHHAGHEIEKGDVLDEEVHRALLHHVDGDLRVRQTADDDERHAGFALTEDGRDLAPVSVRQLEVQQDQHWAVFIERIKGRRASVGHANGNAFTLKGVANELADAFIVIDNEAAMDHRQHRPHQAEPSTMCGSFISEMKRPRRLMVSANWE